MVKGIKNIGINNCAIESYLRRFFSAMSYYTNLIFMQRSVKRKIPN